MKKLLSLPPNLVDHFHELYKADHEEWFCDCDPQDMKVGSGGGTISLIDRWKSANKHSSDNERMIIVHACGESRRLPAYAPLGKVLTPIPVFRWTTGQPIDQTLLSLQMPLFETIMSKAPETSKALIASGDVYIHNEGDLPKVPAADVVCYGIWAEATLASHHGVFVVDRATPDYLKYMLQKPSVSELSALSESHYFLMDIGVWLLSERALQLLDKRSKDNDGNLKYYDLYSEYGCALGSEPTVEDDELNSLTVAIVPLTNGEFYHYGTSAELVSSTLALQSKVVDQRMIHQSKVKPSDALFTQNCRMEYKLDSTNRNIWIENAHIGQNWKLTSGNIITGIPVNDWSLSIPEGICLDIVPVGDSAFAIRPYGYCDAMRGLMSSPETMWMGRSVKQWFADRNLQIIEQNTDIQNAKIFPVLNDMDVMERVANWMINDSDDKLAARIWCDAIKLSANEITQQANLTRIAEMRETFQKEDIVKLGKNYTRSVFYQLDLDNLSQKIKSANLPIPQLSDDAQPIIRARNMMLRWKVTGDIKAKNEASRLLRETILSSIDNSDTRPQPNAYTDQIIWSRSPVRIDLGGGWTDTPPYSLTNGANVVNMAIELNGQPPLQAYIRPCKEHHIIIRSIDMGASEVIDCYENLTDFFHVGSPFSIPKAALTLAGFAPGYSPDCYSTLRQQLEAFGSGIELTILSAVPAGSGLGTSSILASTVLAVINEFAGLAWDKMEICRRTLALEQLLTTGGGWQDQFGGVLGGVKLLQTSPGIVQAPTSRWLPDNIFTDPYTSPCHMLYYTGITRVAKNILQEIVNGMFLNNGEELRLLNEMKRHALNVADALQRNEFERFGQLINMTWQQNQALDSGTNPPQVKAIIDSISDLCSGLKLPGAGGGGFIYMVAKSPEAASRIKQRLENNAPNARARFVNMSVSRNGLQTSRS